MIEKIVNLESLTKLKWLDLSFNRIAKIEGLHTLSELQDLSLFGNKITLIEGLEGCPKLQCLSLGNNNIKTMDQIIGLRKLSELRMLTLAGNEVCNENEYKTTALAYLKDLRYFDYTLVDQNEVSEARNVFYEYLQDLEENETVLEGKKGMEKSAEDYFRQLGEAGILFAETLFDDMFREDAEVVKLKHLPNIKEIVDDFRADFKEDSKAFIKEALDVFFARKAEGAKFEAAFKHMRLEDDKVSRALVEDFSTRLKHELATMDSNVAAAASSSPSLASLSSLRAAFVEKLLGALETVSDELMSMEVRQVEKFEGLLDEFENKLNDLKIKSLDLQQQFFRKMEDSEEKFSRNVRDTISDLIEKHSRDELAEDYLEDEALALVLDKDTCLGLVTTSHDMHVGKILKGEEESRMLETRSYLEEVGRYTREERSRNRDRVLQIYDFGRMSKEALEARLTTDDDEGFDDDFAQ